MLEKFKNLYHLKQKADAMKKKMGTVWVAVEERGVKVVMRGDQHLEELFVDGEKDERLKDVLNKALKETQKKAAKKMQGDLGDLGIPGL